jgi:hypothetical protein
MLWALALGLCAQVIIDPSATNIVAAMVIVAATVPVVLYVRNTNAVDEQPLSTLMLLGFCITTLFGALLAQSVAGKSVSASLRQPVITFATLAAYEWLALAVHAVYRLFTNPTRPPSLVRRGLDSIGLYKTPSVPALWILGVIGCLSYCLPRPDSPDAGPSSDPAGGGLLSAVALAFNFLISAPFLIPLYRKIEGPEYSRSPWVWPGLALYTLLALVLALVRNARVIMFVGVATVGLAYLLVALQSRATLRRGAFLRLGIALLGLVIIIGPVSDLATAMAVARASRGKVSGKEMIATTLHVLRKPYLIQQYRDRQEQAGRYDRYDEYYIANPLFARLVETKFHDNALFFSSTLVTRDSKTMLTRTSTDFLWAILPSPILKRIGIHIDKDNLNFSMGDYLAYLSRGVPLGGRKTGSIFAQGQVVFGVLFPFVFVLLSLALFKWMDVLCRRAADGSAFPVTLALLTSWQLIHLLGPESLHQGVIAIVRTLPQDIAVYVLMLWIARLLSGYGAKSRHEIVAPAPAQPATS